MTRTYIALMFLICAGPLRPAPAGAAAMTSDFKLFREGFPRRVGIVPGTAFTVCIGAPGEVTVLDKDLGELAASFPSSEENFSVSPDGRAVAVVTSSSAVTLHSPPSWEPAGEIEVDSPRSAAFSPDGNFLAVGRAADGIYVYHLPELERYYTVFLGDSGAGELKEMAFSPDGRFFAAASGNRTGAAWDASDWHKIGDFKAPASSVKFTYDGRFLAAAPEVYSLTPRKIKKERLPEGEERFLGAKFSKEKDLLVTAENGSLLLFNAATRFSTGTPVSFPGAISEFDLSPDGKFVATASTPSGTLSVTVLEGGAEMYVLELQAGLALSAEGKHEEALAMYLAAKAVEDTPEINGKIADAGYRAFEKSSDAAAAAGDYDAAAAALRAALRYRPDEEGKLKLRDLAAKTGSSRFSGLVAAAAELEGEYEYGKAAAKLREALAIKADPKVSARAGKLEKRELLAVKYRKQLAQGNRALKKRDYGAAVTFFTKAVKLIDTPEARRSLEEARNNFRR
ncbi:MAG: WD40 repeat domain-containing protein [Elusimicrobia bacterium]|nr:WD40 repeat domain-containing protein [Elusimicrobiota bacterium]